MYLSDFYVERFGEYSRTGVEGLANGLNLIFEHADNDRSPIVAFLRAVFGGHLPTSRNDAFYGALQSCGGLVGLETEQGRQTLRRYDDRRYDSPITIERTDGTVAMYRGSAEWFSGMPSDLIQRSFLVDFQQAPDLHDLLAAVGGIEWDRRHSKQHRQTLENELHDGERRLAALQRDIAALDRSHRELTDRHQQLKTDLKNHVHVDEPTNTPELESIDAEISRWKRAAKDLIARRKTLTEQCDALEAISRQSDSAESSLCSALIALEGRIEQMGKSVTQIGKDANDKAAAALNQGLTELQDKLLEAGAALKLRHLEQRYRRKKAERRQLRRCESEMRHVLKLLVRRRNAVIKRLGEAKHQQPASAQMTSGAAKSESTQKAVGAKPHRPRKKDVQTLRDLEREIERVTDARGQRLAELNACELNLADRRAELADPGALAGLLESASRFLHRLTGGIWTNLEIDQDGVIVIQRDVDIVDYARLDMGTRHQVYLAACLAIAEEQRRLGRALPLVFNAPFTHFPSQQVRTALELLAEVSRKQQIICVTRYEHVTSVGRLLNIPIHVHRKYEMVPARYRVHESVSVSEHNQAGARNRRHQEHTKQSPQLTARTKQELPSPLWGPIQPVEDSPRMPRGIADLHPVARFLDGDNPESRLPSARSNSDLDCNRVQARMLDDGPHEDDPVERAPSIDAQNAERLRRIGILRIGDLLRVSTDEIAEDLRPTGVTATMIDSWRCQARLSCAIQGLRPYDARILVGCGIRTPEQLMGMQPSALRARVKDFASSAEGQAVLLSGTEFELSRVTDWISEARDLPGRNNGELSSKGHPPAAEAVPVERRRGKTANKSGDRAKPRQDVDETSPSARAAAEFYLHESDGLSAVPWIAESTATELAEVGIATVGHLLGQTAESIADQLPAGRITVDLVRQWQQQVALVCRVPRLRLDDSRVLVAIGVTTMEQLAATTPKDLWQKVTSYCESEGRKLARTSDPPPKEEVGRWIAEARRARVAHAA